MRRVLARLPQAALMPGLVSNAAWLLGALFAAYAFFRGFVFLVDWTFLGISDALDQLVEDLRL